MASGEAVYQIICTFQEWVDHVLDACKPFPQQNMITLDYAIKSLD